MRTLMTVILMTFATGGFSQSIVGKWKTIDDDTGKAKSVVEIYKKSDGKYYGKITKLFREPGGDQDPVCSECDEDDLRHNKKIKSMEIIKELEKDGNMYEEGNILDPNNGTVYDCKIWREGNKLKVRGYVAFFYRTQTWYPYNG
ncbi:MAG: hypothetical protein COA57_05345 [Flavobacteriales bacterium]|nr:MAG: hypothetical protein COA57_05345 [Flavobacteriales bacterium]